MEPDKYQQAWQADAARTRVTIDADLLLQEVQRSQKEFRSTIFWRDFREVAVGLSMLPLWFFMGAMLSLPWTWYLTVPALLWVAGFILMDRRRHPQRPSEPGEPLLYYVKESLAQVEHQIWLLRNVFWWYLLPFCLSILAFFFHVSWRTSSYWWEVVIMSLLGVVFLFVVYGWVYRLNQSAVRVQLEPRRQDLSKLLATLEGETTSVDSDEVAALVSTLAKPIGSCGQGSDWGRNWNVLIPSWREATAILFATLSGAICGLWIPIPQMGPVFFRSVIGAVIAFEIALGCAWWRSRKRMVQSPPEGQSSQRLPRAPAILIIALTLVISLLAVLAILRFMAEAR